LSGSILEQGFNLMAFGMGTVFVFLTLLVIATSMMSSFICKFFPEAEQESKPSVASAKQKDEQQVVSAIMAAIKLHRSKK
jgi:oxaloacetate decarboxylase gamma subunit